MLHIANYTMPTNANDVHNTTVQAIDQQQPFENRYLHFGLSC